MREENAMRHIRTISHERPAKAQFEPILQFLSVLSASLNLLVLVSDIFGLDLPSKGGETT